MGAQVFVVGTFMGTETFSWAAFSNMVVVTLGVGIAAYGEVNFVLVRLLGMANGSGLQGF